MSNCWAAWCRRRRATRSSIASRKGFCRRPRLSELCMVIMVWLDPRCASDENLDRKDLYRTNYEATKLAISRAIKGEPTIDELIKNRKSVSHYALEGVFEVRASSAKVERLLRSELAPAFCSCAISYRSDDSIRAESALTRVWRRVVGGAIWPPPRRSPALPKTRSRETARDAPSRIGLRSGTRQAGRCRRRTGRPWPRNSARYSSGSSWR